MVVPLSIGRQMKSSAAQRDPLMVSGLLLGLLLIIGLYHIILYRQRRSDNGTSLLWATSAESNRRGDYGSQRNTQAY